MRNIEELITVDNLPCEDCNFKTDPSTRWHFGKMPFAEVHNRPCTDVISTVHGGKQARSTLILANQNEHL
jgi:hypothetical protein